MFSFPDYCNCNFTRARQYWKLSGQLYKIVLEAVRVTVRGSTGGCQKDCTRFVPEAVDCTRLYWRLLGGGAVRGSTGGCQGFGEWTV